MWILDDFCNAFGILYILLQLNWSNYLMVWVFKPKSKRIGLYIWCLQWIFVVEHDLWSFMIGLMYTFYRANCHEPFHWLIFLKTIFPGCRPYVDCYFIRIMVVLMKHALFLLLRIVNNYWLIVIQWTITSSTTIMLFSGTMCGVCIGIIATREMWKDSKKSFSVFHL